jgi:Leucine-rich repeat (LRR) protein
MGAVLNNVLRGNAMKQTVAILLLVSLVVGCGESHNSQVAKVMATAKVKAAAEANAEAWVSDPNDSNNVKIEAAIRKEINKPTGELTKVDLEKVTELDLNNNQLTDVTGLEKLTQLKKLDLASNPDLTKAQIDQLKKALPDCKIYD